MKKDKSDSLDIPMKLQQPLSAFSYAVISLIAFAIGIGILLLFILKAPDLIAQGIGEKVFYILLIPLGLSAAAFLFGAMNSFASYSGKQLSGTLKLGGPVIVFILVIIGGFKLVPDTQPFDFTIILYSHKVKSQPVFKTQGVVKILLDGEFKESEIYRNGSTYFKNIPTKFRDKEVEVQLEFKRWKLCDNNPKVRLRGKAAKLEIEPDGSLAKLYGQVRNENNKPIEGVNVSVEGITKKEVTDKNGEFTFNIPVAEQEEEYNVKMYKKGYKLWEKTVYPESDAINIILKYENN